MLNTDDILTCCIFSVEQSLYYFYSSRLYTVVAEEYNTVTEWGKAVAMHMKCPHQKAAYVWELILLSSLLYVI